MIIETFFDYLQIGVAVITLLVLVTGGYFGWKKMQANVIHDLIENDKLFTKVPGFKEFFVFFQDKDPDSIVRRLGMMSNLADELRLYREEKEILQNVLRATGVDEPTSQIYAKIAENHKLFTRFREFRQSKIFIRNNLTSQNIIKDILLQKTSIFIESGSTLSYAALAILEHIKQNNKDQKMICVCTNNIIIYILLLFEELIEPKLLPGLPINAYGATFGNRRESELCNIEEVKKFLKENNVEALFTTASFISAKLGPHVSSEANHKIKTVLNGYAEENEIENILVISSEKIDDAYKVKDFSKNCKLIFDPEGRNIEEILTNPEIRDKVESKWKKFLSNKDNAIMIGSQNSDATDQANQLLTNRHLGLVPYPIPGSKEGSSSILRYLGK